LLALGLALVACGGEATPEPAAPEDAPAEVEEEAAEAEAEEEPEAEEEAEAEEEMAEDESMMSEIDTLRFGNFNPNYASNTLPEISDEMGWLAEGGLTELEMTFADQSTLFPGLLGGSLEVVAQDTDAVAGAHVAGETDFVIVSIYRDKEPWMLAFQEGIDVSDLSGVTCSGGGAGGRNEFNAKAMVERLGGNPDDVEWIPIGGGSDARVTAFAEEGQIDCVQHFDRHRQLVIDAGGTTLYDELEEVPQDGFVVLRSWAEENPRAVVSILKGFILARDFHKDIANQDAVIEIMTGRDYEIPPEFVDQYERALQIIGIDGHFEIAAMEALIADSVRTGSLEESVDWRTIVDMSYLNQAYEELGMSDRVVDYGE
jgi:ABC-type nitrate/sulfonate/bicarbonate transport system substrate-binding protein